MAEGETITEKDLDKSIIDKIDESFDNKAKELASKKVDTQMDELMKKYDNKFEELNTNFDSKLDAINEDYAKKLEDKDKQIEELKDSTNSQLDKLSSRQSIPADGEQKSSEPQTKEEFRQWYRTQPDEVKVELDKRFFEEKLARQGL